MKEDIIGDSAGAANQQVGKEHWLLTLLASKSDRASKSDIVGFKIGHWLQNVTYKSPPLSSSNEYHPIAETSRNSLTEKNLLK